MKIAIAASALLIASQAHALTAYSRGGDTGYGAQTDVVSFDAPNAPGVTETDAGPVGSVGLHTGTSAIAATPVGDTTQYEAIQPGGSATFDFTKYGKVGALSVYVGSIDAYNNFEVSTTSGNYFYNGDDFLHDNGDQHWLETNREVYFWAGKGEDIKSIEFGSTGIAFEYDDIAVGGYHAGQGIVPLNADANAEVLLPTSFIAAPEASTWALMIVGMFGMGASLRFRRGRLGVIA